MEHEVLDEEIAEYLFGVSRETIEAWPWGVPEFSSDRRWSSAVVTEMYGQPAPIRILFEQRLQALADKARAKGGKGGLVELMVINTPEEICKAALWALGITSKDSTL